MSKKLFGKFFIFLLVVGLLFAVAPTGQAEAATLDVCTSGCTYSSIQAAITAAANGDVITVGPGTYYGAITINKEVTLQSTAGPATTIIHGGLTVNDTMYTVVIRSSNVTLNGFTVTSPNYNPAAPWNTGDPIGISIGYYGDNSLSNIVINNNYVTQIGSADRLVTVDGYPSVGIVVNGVVAGLQITNNKVYDIHQTVTDPAVTWGPTGIGFYGYDTTPLSSGVIISGNEVYNISANAGAPASTISNGIRAGWGSGDVTIASNIVHDIDGRAIAVTSANNGVATITSNTISNADTGIYLGNAGGGVLSGNTFTNVLVNVDQLPVHNITKSVWYATIQDAVTASAAGDVIEVIPGTYVVGSQIAINKAITLQGQPGAKIQVSGSLDIFDIAAGATLTGFEIEKTDEITQTIIRIRSSNVTISSNHIHGLYDLGDGQVDRAMVINAGAFTGISITGNEIHNLRQPAYISGTHTGSISANNVYTTRGWVLEGGNLTFTDNTWGDGAHPNAVDIAILGTMPAPYYTDIVAMSDANNNAVIEDQRTTPAVLADVYVDDSVVTSGNGTQASPYKTIVEALPRVAVGGTIHVAAGTYTENLTISKPLTLQGTVDTDGTRLSKIVGTGATPTINITASYVTFDSFDYSAPGANGIVISNDAPIPTTAYANITINNNYIHDIGGGYGGATKAIKSSHGVDNLTITNNIFDGITNTIGTATSNRSSNVITIGETDSTDPALGLVIKGNTFRNISAIKNAAVAININNKAGATGVVEDNIFEVDTILCGPTCGGSAISIEGSLMDLDVLRNAFTATSAVPVNTVAVYVADPLGTSFPNVNFASNNFVAGAITNASTAGTLNATGNWWGQDTGPAAGQIIGNVASCGWLNAAYPDGVAVAKPVNNTSSGVGYCTIQTAIDAATAGDVITVAAGTYVEDLVIDKAVTLLGPNAAINPNMGTRVEEAIIKSTVDGAVITQVTGVSIKGFTFDGQGTSDSGIYSYDGPSSVIIENNILTNHDYGALVFYNYNNSGNATVNNVIKNNKIETVTGEYGLGILLYSNFYAEVSGNVISEVRVGIQTGNYYWVNTGAAATLSNNKITATRRGIFHNLHYSDASTFTITGNSIFAQDLVTGTTFDGIMLSSIQSAVDAVVTNNTITVGEITQAPTAGYMIWNNPTTATLSIEGGSVTGADYGVFVNNFEGYSSNADSTIVTIDGITITGAEVGIYVKDSPLNTNNATVAAIIKNNVITATTGIKIEGADATATGDHNQVYATTDVENTNPVSMNFENNYWDSPCGATVVGLVDTIPWFEDAAMLVSKDTNPSGNLTLTPPMTTLEINNTLACAAPYSTITFNAGTVDYPGDIIIPEGRDHLTIVLADGVKINANSPCITVNADYTTIEADNIGMAACVTVAGSNGIDVAAGVVNLTVDGLEIYGAGNDGIHFNGVITDVVLKDNFIHDLAGNGVFFGAQPVAQTVGAIDIHGNMFQNNGGNGIEAGAYTVPAEYNSWGNVAGAAAGDGASSGVVADPFTHVDIYLESSGTPWANQVVSGQTITYTVMGHLVNASGADFVLTYPENLTYVSSTAPKTFGLLDAVTHTAGSRSLQFMGYSTTGNKTGTLPLFNVTFTAGTPVVAAPMLLNELTDGFTMDVVGSSNNIYAAALLDSSVTIVTLPTISSADIQGYYLTGEQRQFSVVLDNPSTGADYAHVYVDFTMTNAQVEQISLIEYSVDNGTTWVALGTGPGTSFANVGTDIVGYFGKVTGGGFPMAPGASLPTLFRVTFVTREQGAIDFPTSYAVSMKLMDADAAIQLDDFAATMQVYDKPTITSTDIQGYYLTGEQREFHVTGANPLTGKNYSNVMYKIILPNTVIADITNIQYYETYPTTGYVPLALTQDGANVVAWFGLASYGGFPMAPGFSDSPSFLVTFATAKEYSVLIEQYDVALEPDRLLVAETFTADVYTPPVITATFPTGPYAAGVPVTVDVDITNPSSIPAPFELVFDLPAGTVISYGGTDYVCAATCPPIVVTLPLVDGQFSITFDEAWTGTAGLSLFDSDWTPADRLLATASQTGVVVNDDFAVTGTFSMQGRSTRAGIPVTLTWGGALGPYTKSANTIDAISNNFSLTLTYGGTYTVTTAQPRYLNVTTANAKTLSVPLALGKTMNPLELKAGNAKWDDNIINDQDSGMIASGYIQGITLFPNADVNFDNKINIQDLALVGGNYFVDSTVYNSWIVVTP